MKNGLCKLRNIHNVNVPLRSMRIGFNGEVGFAHAAGILYVHLKFMFLTYRMSIRHNISKNGMYSLFKNKKKRETCTQ